VLIITYRSDAGDHRERFRGRLRSAIRKAHREMRDVGIASMEIRGAGPRGRVYFDELAPWVTKAIQESETRGALRGVRTVDEVRAELGLPAVSFGGVPIPIASVELGAQRWSTRGEIKGEISFDLGAEITDEQRRAIGEMMTAEDACEACGRDCHGDRKIFAGLHRCAPCRGQMREITMRDGLIQRRIQALAALPFTVDAHGEDAAQDARETETLEREFLDYTGGEPC